MRFSEVAERASRDQKFFEELQATARRAARDGFGSDAWRELATYFAENKDELKLLSPPPQNFRRGRIDNALLSMNLLEVLIWNSGGFHGTTTSTTATTSLFCTLPGDCGPEHGRPHSPFAPEGKAKKGTAKSAAKKSRATKKG